MKASFQPELLREPFARFEDAAEVARAQEQAASFGASWRFASDDMSVLEPFREQLYGDKAKWRKENAKPRKYDFRHGLDSNQRVRIVEDLEGRYVSHLEYFDEYILRFAGDTSVRRFEFDEHQQLVAHHILYPGHGQQREYGWTAGRLDTVELISWDHDYKSPGTDWSNARVTSHILQSYRYDEDGLFQIIDQYLNDDGSVDAEIGELVTYTRIPKGKTAASIGREISTRLVAETPRLVEEASTQGSKFYALLLCYCAEEPAAGWPPFLLLTNESVLSSRQWSSEEIKYYAWAPDELREMEDNIEICFDSEELNSLCSLHAQIMLQKGPASMKRALKDTIAKLQEFDWARLIDLTDDFVIAAVDNTGEIEPARDIKKCAPDEFRNLSARGMI